ncbi:hydrogenase expression/formation protein HypE [Ammoniphilus sp. CFH 90114]|uniref:hydrogenase expression/formation protein HypE n=1 Tax=Ammoniphilus sp. CFH 90114 TaxID=2493665 RepID=UPI00100DAE18|nr:hydrogenase expression/formation protein HypE [Ammoniphilus sp. CFH 90114]RXT07952.1 hydrogenase expression/formation protein HypE [Ammoniphilus sp. CFH 90114]
MKILLSHGDGGKLTHELVKNIFHRAFHNDHLQEEGDAAALTLASGNIMVSTDSYVISPMHFPGGNIGKLAITGTMNDLAVSGAIPQYITAGFILEEGLDMEELRGIVQSMAHTAQQAGVRLVAGDTKVVERGKGDGLYINTTGIGINRHPGRLAYSCIQPGDRILINGAIAEHTIAVLSARAGLEFSPPILSDCASLHSMIQSLLDQFHSIRFMRDPTRGGVATTLQEIALKTSLDLELYEEHLPVTDQVRGAVEILGLDPLYLANEGKVILIVGEQEADAVIKWMREKFDQQLAGVIGRVRKGQGKVWLKTAFGGTRRIEMLSGAPLPRIC